MTESVQYFLSRDIYSHCNKTRRYGKKDDPIHILSHWGGQYAVKGPDGQQFYILAEEMYTKGTIEEIIPSAKTSPATVESKVIKKKVRKSKDTDPLQLF